MIQAIEVKNLGKKFRLRHAAARSLKTSAIERLLHRETREDFWALKNISFDVGRGEILGIIGPNGGGKTTLLSLLAQTMVPTVGTLKVEGKISSLLELGAGFHPDLTGRENIFLNASIMGMPRSGTEKKFQRIVDFSGLGHFIETPIKFYSSGMVVRLGFSVAVEVEPDILLVDEVLSVGDAAFQKKSGERIEEFKKAGKTIVVVSHDMNRIRNFCQRAIYLKEGEIIRQGAADEVINYYLEKTLPGGTVEGTAREWGNRAAEIRNVRFFNQRGELTRSYRLGDEMRIEIDFSAHRKIEDPVFGFAIHDEETFTHCLGSNTQMANFDIPSIEGEGTVILSLKDIPLQTGRYLLSLSLHSRDHLVSYHRQEYFHSFSIISPRSGVGILNVPMQWSLGKDSNQ